ncbi:MAG TPA: hypothetical protein VII28_14280 [Puia sp.]
MKYLIFFILLISIYLAASANCENHHPPTANRQPPTIIHQPPTANRQPPTDLNRSAFYKAMEETDKALVNSQLEELKSAPADLKPAFMGAMMMKRASFIGNAVAKLHYFKEGHKMLEAAIKQDPENTEFHFLRLMIEEHAPGVLGYNKDIEKDCALIRKNYASLPGGLQQTITNYSKKSKFLKLDLS